MDIRLGHPSQAIMKAISPVKYHNSSSMHDKCSICPIAKQTRLKFPTSSSRSASPFKLVHMDLWGSYNIPTLNKKHYFLTNVDDYTRFTWVYLLQLKFDVIVILQQFFNMVKNQFGVMLKILRSDNGTEFFNSQCTNLLQQLGIVH